VGHEHHPSYKGAATPAGNSAGMRSGSFLPLGMSLKVEQRPGGM
jgi:hypothetical protein